MEQKCHHFLIVTFPVQGHLNPSRYLAKHLTRIAPGTRVTFSTPISGHRRMFPSSASSGDQIREEGDITYIPFSDGDDDDSACRDIKTYITDLELSGSLHLDQTVARFAAGDHPITCIIYTLLLPWAGRIARKHNLPCAQFWIQPATVLAICYHYFHGYQTLISSHSNNPSFNLDLPNLPTIQIRDIPTYLTITDPQNPKIHLIPAIQDTIEAMKIGDKVLINTFDELEPDAIRSMKENLQMFAIGPVIPEEEADEGRSESRRYMDWLDEQEEGSVVYVSFGTNLVLNENEMEEIRKGLKGIGRPYLWSKGRMEKDKENEEEEEGKKGMEMGWCAQWRVLGHSAVGCFVTHCGWNSTAESMVAGVPVVAATGRWADQATNGWMVEMEWGIGVRMGKVEEGELRRCVEMVMGGEKRGEEIRIMAGIWKRRAKKALQRGGSSDRNLRDFLRGLK